MVKIHNKSGACITLFGQLFSAGETKDIEILYDNNVKLLEKQGIISVTPVNEIPSFFGSMDSTMIDTPTKKRRSSKQEIISDEDNEVNKITESERE